MGLSLQPPFLIASYYSDPPKNKENPDERIINNTKFIINFPKNSLESEAGNNIDCAGTTPEVPGEAVEGY